MFKQKEIIANKLAHLEKMRGYLAYSSGSCRVDKDAQRRIHQLPADTCLAALYPPYVMHQLALVKGDRPCV